MQAEVIFAERVLASKTVTGPRRLPIINLLPKFRRLIVESSWDEHLLLYEKHVNRVFWLIIIASAAFFAPVCVNIFMR